MIVAVTLAGTCTAGLVAGPAGAQSAREAPKATEVGVSSSTIRIGVIADVDNAFAPGLFKGAVDGVKAAAKYLNSKAGGGGVAGRKLVVDFYDSKLEPNESRNATITACQNDLAMVGTSAVVLNTVDDIVNCPNQAGDPVGIPDVSSLTATIAQSCSPVSFPIVGVSFVCSTMDDNPQTYYGNQGEAQYLLSKHNDLHGPMVQGSTGGKGSPNNLAATMVRAGIEAVPGDPVGVSPIAPQSVYTPIIHDMKQDGSNFALSTSSADQVLAMRNEATLQGLDSSKIVWDAVAVYGNKIVPANASAFEGQYQSLSFLPFEERRTNPMLANFLEYMKKVGGTPDQFSAYSWMATMAFADGVKAAVDKGGVNALTRASLLDGLRTLTDFDAGGMAGAHSFATNKSTSCFVEVQFVSGRWVRVHPKKAGTFDCTPSNSITFKANLTGA